MSQSGPIGTARGRAIGQEISVPTCRPHSVCRRNPLQPASRPSHSSARRTCWWFLPWCWPQDHFSRTGFPDLSGQHGFGFAALGGKEALDFDQQEVWSMPYFAADHGSNSQGTVARECSVGPNTPVVYSASGGCANHQRQASGRWWRNWPVNSSRAATARWRTWGSSSWSALRKNSRLSI